MMSNKRIVITGGIATGKSTATAILQRMGYPVIDADRIARSLLDPGEPAYQEVIDAFGKGILQSDGTIDRKALGDLIFSSPEKRALLNDITHPRVVKKMEESLRTLKDESLVFLDIPLYYEAKGMPVYPVWLIYAPEAMQKQRLMDRDGITEKQAMARISAQMPIEEKRQLAERVVYNTEDIETLTRRLQRRIGEEITNGD